MSIFVNPNQTMPVRVKFLELIGENNRVTGIRVLPDDAEGEHVKLLVCDAVGRDFDNMSRIMEVATVINHVTGRPMVRKSVLFRQVILTFFKAWNFCDDAGAMIDITFDRVNHMHDALVRALAWKWLKITGGRITN